MNLRAAHFKEEEFVADVKRASQEEPDRLHAWWLGQSGFLAQWEGRHVLFDPYLSDSLTRKYAGTEKEHTRMTERVIPPEKLDFIDLVTSSHNHTDHLDAETLGPLLRANPGMDFIVPAANREFAAERLSISGDRMLPLADGESHTTSLLTIHGLASAHNEREVDELGRDKFMGFILEWGPWTIYHSGDTMLYEGLEERLSRFDIDLAFLPINGFKPERKVAGNLDAREAVTLAKATGMKHVVPHHFHMFTFNTVEPDEFATLANEAGVAATVLENGERLALAAV
jgi:L-ascorbate metabolism protein UlaG (beta-lactamase superfamily)